MTRDEMIKDFLDHMEFYVAARGPGYAQAGRDIDALLAATRREALEEAAKLVLEQAMQWDAPDADDPGCERTVLLNARNAIRARGGV